MPSRIPKAAADIKIWGLALNDALRIIQGQGKIIVALNGNNPPTVKQGTKFWVYKEDTYLTPSSPVTGNNVYPVDTSITYPVSEAIFEPADRTFAFGDTNFPAAIGASKTYYLWCSGAEDTDEDSQGRGTYGMDETAPTWSDDNNGWYNASGYRVIATVKSTVASAIDASSLIIYRDAIPAVSSITASTGAIANTDTVISKGIYIPANKLTPETHMKIEIIGTYTAAAAVNSIFTVRMGTNNTVADAAKGTVTIGSPSSGTNIGFKLVIDITVRTIGSSGTIYGFGTLINDLTASGILNGTIRTYTLGAIATIDTTAANYLNVSFISGHASNAGTFQNVITSVKIK